MAEVLAVDDMSRASLATAGGLFPQLLPWLIGLLFVVVIGAVAIYLIRRTVRGGGRGTASEDGFTLQELRDLHAAGDLSDEQFARAREAIIGGLTARSTASSPHDSKQGDGEAAPR